MRDYQRRKVYTSERSAWENYPACAVRLETVEEMQSFVNRVIESKWLESRLWRPSDIAVIVRDGRGRRRPCATKGTIKMPKWSRYTLVLCHELAHVLLPFVNSSRNVASHGREFCNLYLRLVHEFMGVEAFRALSKEFRENRVRYSGTDADWKKANEARKKRRTPETVYGRDKNGNLTITLPFRL